MQHVRVRLTQNWGGVADEEAAVHSLHADVRCNSILSRHARPFE